MRMDKPTEEQESNPSRPQNNFLRFSGLAFQMLATFLLAFWGGQALDRYWDLAFPILTILLLFLAVVGTVIMLIKNLPKD